MSRWIIVFIAFCGLFGGVSALLKKRMPMPAVNVATDRAPSVVSFGPKPTEEEAREFGQKLEQAAASANRISLKDLLKVQELAERSVQNLQIDPNFRDGLIKGIRSRSADTQLIDEIINTVKSGGKFTFLRTAKDGENLQVIMRMNGDEGMNYLKIKVARFPDNKIASEDIFNLITGEYMSQTFRRFFLIAAASVDRPLLERLGGSEQAMVKDFKKIEALGNAAHSQQGKQGVEIYRQLPEELKNMQIVLMPAMQCASQANENDVYLEIMERYRNNFGNTGSLDLLSIDYFLLNKKYDEAQKAIDNVDKSVGGDPLLNVLRSNIYVAAGKFSEAKKVAEDAIAKHPKMEDLYWTRIMISLQEKNHTESLSWLKKLCEQTGIQLDWQVFQSKPECADFLKSPEAEQLHEWLKNRQK